MMLGVYGVYEYFLTYEKGCIFNYEEVSEVEYLI